MDPNPLSDLIVVLPFTWEAVVSLVFVILLLCVSAFVSASEVAFFSLSPQDLNEIEADSSSVGNNIRELRKEPEHLLGTILITNNFVNVAIVMLSTLCLNLTFDFSNAPWLGFLIQTVIITFLLLLFGEIMPKIFASQNPLRMCRRAAGALKRTGKVLRPFTKLLVGSTNIVNKQLSKHKHNSNISIDDLSQALELTSDSIEEDADILKGIVHFGNITAAGVMTPRLDMVTVDINDTFDKVVDCIVEHEYSRMPVLANTYDDIRGILYAKDLIPHLGKGDNFKWQTLIRSAYFVPETKKIDDLLQEFRKNKIHIAIVVDEFGGTSGMVTMEDILEEVVGDISDEYDQEEMQYRKVDDNTYMFEAKILLTDFFKATDIDPAPFADMTGEVDTLAGLILEIKGEIPEEHEVVTYGNCKFEVTAVDDRRIKEVKLTIDRNGDEKDEED